MKKFLVIALSAAFVCVSSQAFAGKLKDNVGCGVGTLLFESAGHSDGGWLLQVTADWTNGFFTNTFSMTSGTVGCKGNINEVVNYQKAYEFVTANMDNLAKDAAMGQGETISSLATILEVSDVDTFAQNIQSNFSEIFTSADVQSDYVLVKIIEVNS